MRMIIAAAALALLAPAAALAESPAPAIVAAGAQGQPLVCRYYYHEGQVIRRPVCKTEHEWIRDRLREQQDISQYQLRGLIQHP
jgi:hypothetical protein